MYEVIFTTKEELEFTCYVSAETTLEAIDSAVNSVRNQYPQITIKTLKSKKF